MPDGSWTWEQTASARKGGDGIRLGIIPKVEPAELLKVPASKGKRESRPISTVNASIATSIRASRSTVE
jgi:hypothetical protein